MDIRLYQLRTQPLEQMLPRLLDKVYGAGDKAVVLVNSSERAAVLDRQLWTFSTASFLPHALIDDPMAMEAPILLTTQLANPQAAALLVVADGQALLPQMAAARETGFTQVVEILEHEQAEHLQNKVQEYNDLNLNPKVFVQQLNGTWLQQDSSQVAA
ncbi:MAG: DNA polymerase III subunit chi [Alphaproteobacteria bacterium]|nr:DNA polymerase III subunit chi [Alphaproteobacteria bacterium]